MRHEDMPLFSKRHGLEYLNKLFKGRKDVGVLPHRVYQRLEDIPLEDYRKEGAKRVLIRAQQKAGAELTMGEYKALPRIHIDLGDANRTKMLEAFREQTQKAGRPLEWIVHPLGEASQDRFTGVITLWGNPQTVIKLQSIEGDHWAMNEPYWRVYLDATKGAITGPITDLPYPKSPKLQRMREENPVAPEFREKLVALARELHKNVPYDVRAHSMIQAKFSTTKTDPHRPVFYDYLILRKTEDLDED